MAAQAKVHERKRPPIAQGLTSGLDQEWDAVSQASWESFPASDPPAWINAARVDWPPPTPAGS